ncbi:hypothetical protein BDV12DRAFT_70423 [Aspergillus spectabilis]
MVGLGPKNGEQVPPYEELESQGPRNLLTGYSSVPQNIDDEEQPPPPHQPQPHQHTYLNTRASCRSNPSRRHRHSSPMSTVSHVMAS